MFSFCLLSRSFQILRKNFFKKNTSKYTGVWWNHHTKKWVACRKINRKAIGGGQFEDELEAAKASDAILFLHRADLAKFRLNFPVNVFLKLLKVGSPIELPNFRFGRLLPILACNKFQHAVANGFIQLTKSLSL